MYTRIYNYHLKGISPIRLNLLYKFIYILEFKLVAKKYKIIY